MNNEPFEGNATKKRGGIWAFRKWPVCLVKWALSQHRKNCKTHASSDLLHK